MRCVPGSSTDLLAGRAPEGRANNLRGSENFLPGAIMKASEPINKEPADAGQIRVDMERGDVGLSSDSRLAGFFLVDYKRRRVKFHRRSSPIDCHAAANRFTSFWRNYAFPGNIAASK